MAAFINNSWEESVNQKSSSANETQLVSLRALDCSLVHHWKSFTLHKRAAKEEEKAAKVNYKSKLHNISRSLSGKSLQNSTTIKHLNKTP